MDTAERNELDDAADLDECVVYLFISTPLFFNIILHHLARVSLLIGLCGFTKLIKSEVSVLTTAVCSKYESTVNDRLSALGAYLIFIIFLHRL